MDEMPLKAQSQYLDGYSTHQFLITLMTPVHTLFSFFLLRFVYATVTGQAGSSKFSKSTKREGRGRSYPNNPQLLTPPLATFKCSHGYTSWTCVDFFKQKNSLGRVITKFLKNPHKSTSFRRESISKLPGGCQYSRVVRVRQFGHYTIAMMAFLTGCKRFNLMLVTK